MAGLIQWASGCSVFSGFAMQLSGQGNQIANGAAARLSGDLFNTGVSGGPALFGMATLVCAQSGFAAAVTWQQPISLYLVPAYDQMSGYPTVDTTNAGAAPNQFKGNFVTPQSGNSQLTMIIDNIPLLPTNYRGYLVNSTGQTLASGWMLFMNGFVEAYT